MGEQTKNAFFFLFVARFWSTYPFPIGRLLSYTVQEQLEFRGGTQYTTFVDPGKMQCIQEIRKKSSVGGKQERRACTNEPKRPSVIQRAYRSLSVRRRVSFVGRETASFSPVQ